MARPDRQKFTAGVVLVLLGLGFYLVQRLDAIGNEVIMLIIGSAFLVAYFYQKAYGLLIPAGILLGLGLGGMMQGRSLSWADDGTQFGLGLGFISIYLIAKIYQRESHWWPLIPGSILILIGLAQSRRIFAYLRHNWSLVLVAVGILILIGAFRRSTDDSPEELRAKQPAPPEPAAAASPREPEEPVEPRIE